MARYNITSLNYMAAGSKRCYVNIDTCLEYQLSEYVYVLDLENHYDSKNDVSGNVRTEQGDLSVVNTRYYQYEDGKERYSNKATGLERNKEGLLIPERIYRVKEGLSSNGKLFLLKQEDNKTEYLDELHKFNQDRFEYNRTFVIPQPTDSDADINILTKGTMDKVYPMYEMTDVCVKMAQKKNKVNPYLKMTDDDIDIYAPSMTEGPVQFCQTYSNAVMLDQWKNNGLYDLRINLSGTEDDAYTTELKADGIETIMYTPCNKLSFDTIVDEYDELSNKIGEHTETHECTSYAQYLHNVGYDAIENIFDDYSHLNGIKYNLIYDLDQTDEGNDYKSGNVAADNIFVGKNLYNSTYSINNDISNGVQNCREYCGLGFSNGAIYLKYYDGIDYDCTMEDEDGHHKKQCSMVEKSTGQYGYQKIEFLQKIKSSKKTKHKSNMFSVNIKNSGIENICNSYTKSTSTKADDIRNSIKKDIKNAVTKIFENVCPANTQLFQVYFEEE